MKMISKQGLPLKITAEWTDNDYWDRILPYEDELTCTNVAGWLIRINGKKFPRGHYGDEDWEDEWVCPSCEYGPMHGDLEKCDRCGCKKDQKFNEYGLDDDGWGEETEEVEEIKYDYY